MRTHNTLGWQCKTQTDMWPVHPKHQMDHKNNVQKATRIEYIFYYLNGNRYMLLSRHNPMQKDKIPSKILEQRHAPFDATDKIKWNTRVYTLRNAIISLISNLLSSIYLFFFAFFPYFWALTSTSSTSVNVILVYWISLFYFI